jgi:hypothetical protein
VAVDVRVGVVGDGGRRELGQRVADGFGPPLDQPVGIEEQRVAGHELERDLVVLGVELHAEQHALGQRLDRG